jgi:hypothetical protein
MPSFVYNDAEFTISKDVGWDIVRKSSDGKTVMIAANLFKGLPAAEAEAKAKAWVKTACPVGVKSVGPDISHAIKVGDLKIVPPDIAHPNFVYWDKDSSSFPKNA